MTDFELARERLLVLGRERLIVNGLVSELSAIISVLIREQQGDDLPNHSDLLRHVKDVEIKCASLVTTLDKTERRIVAREALVSEVKAVDRHVRRLDEWLQLPALKAPEDAALYPAYRERIRDAVFQARAQKDALQLANERVMNAQVALTDAIQVQAGYKTDADIRAEHSVADVMLRKRDKDEAVSRLLITLEREAGAAEQFVELRDGYLGHAAAVLAWSERESTLLESFTADGGFTVMSYTDLDRAQTELMSLQNRQRQADSHLVALRQLQPRLVTPTNVITPLQLAEAAWHSVVALFPPWQQALNEAQSALKSRGSIETEVQQRIRSLDAWLIEAEAALQQLRNAPASTYSHALAGARRFTSQLLVRGHELAHVQKLEVELLALGGLRDTPLLSHGVEVRFEAWRKDSRASLRRVEENVAEQAAVAELKSQIEQRTAAIMNALSATGPELSRLQVGGAYTDIRAQEMRLQFYQQQREDLGRQLEELKSQYQRLSQPGATRESAMGRISGVSLQGADFMSEISSRWDSLQSDFDAKHAAIASAKQNLHRLGYARDSYERERDHLATWMTEERRMLAQSFSVPVEQQLQILAAFRLRKTEQGFPLLDRVEGFSAEIEQLVGDDDSADLKVAQDLWDKLLMLMEATEHNAASRAQKRAAGSALLRDYAATVTPLITWRDVTDNTLRALQVPRNATVIALTANLVHIANLQRECEARVGVLADLIELNATLCENGTPLERDMPSVRSCISSLADISNRCNAAFTAQLSAMESALHNDDLLDMYRLRAGHFVQWCATQRVAIDTGADTAVAVATYEREKVPQQQRLQELESVWLELEATNLDLRALTPAAELASTMRDLGWLAGQRSSRLEAVKERQDLLASMSSQWLEVASQVFPWLGSAVLSLALFKFGRSLEDAVACQKELQEFREQQTAAATTISFLSSLNTQLHDQAGSEHTLASFVNVLSKLVSISWDELQRIISVRTDAVQQWIEKFQQLVAARQSYIDEAHVLHPLLTNVLATAQRVAKHDFLSTSDVEKEEVNQLSILYEQHTPRVHELLASSDILALYGTVALSQGFLSLEEILPRWERFGQLLRDARQARLLAGVKLRQLERQRSVAYPQLDRTQQWLEQSASMLQRALELDVAQPEPYEEAMYALSRIRTEMDTQKRVFARLRDIKADLEADRVDQLLQIDEEWTRVAAMLSVLSEKLTAAIDSQVSHRAKWGRFVGLCTALTNWMQRSEDMLQTSDDVSRQASLSVIQEDEQVFAQMLKELFELEDALGPRDPTLDLDTLGLHAHVMHERWEALQKMLRSCGDYLQAAAAKAAESDEVAAQFNQIASEMMAWLVGLYTTSATIFGELDSEGEKAQQLFTAIQERQPRLLEQHTRLMQLQERLTALGRADSGNPALSLDVLDGHIHAVSTIRKWIGERLLHGSEVLGTAQGADTVVSLRERHRTMAAKFVARVKILHEDIDRAQQAEMQLEDEIDKFIGLQHQCYHMEADFTAICLIDLKLLEAGFPVQDDAIHPMVLRQAWHEVCDRVDVILKELRGRADLQYRMETANLDTLIAQFIEEASAWVDSLQLNNDLQTLQNLFMEVKVFHMRLQYYAAKLEKYSQDSVQAGLQDRAEELRSKWAQLQEKLATLPTEESIDERIQQQKEIIRTQVVFNSSGLAIEQWSSRALAQIEVTDPMPTLRDTHRLLTLVELCSARGAVVDVRLDAMASAGGDNDRLTRAARMRAEVIAACEENKEALTKALQLHDRNYRQTEAYVQDANELLRWLRDRLLSTTDRSEMNSLELVEAYLHEIDSIMSQLPQMREKFTELVTLRKRIESAGAPLPADEALSTDTIQDMFQRLDQDGRARIDQLKEQQTRRNDCRMAFNITVEQLQEFGEVFDHFDADGSGAIDRDEFKTVMRALGEELSDDQCDVYFDEIDADKSNTIDFEEFVTLMKRKFKPIESIEDYLGLFVEMADQRGVLTRERLQQSLETALSITDMEQLLQLIKMRPNGSVDYTGLVATLFER
eukprot:TRINITY_DN4122_c0_g1_i1.p1 TRINITY_DN4122_c0_g1~~TRINITY_DN4122_c0_g1_i1.p1  ORF type:complete len:2095 (+),score=667.61 TRINITY_DN4122_c0_g1_i1:230-6286(+)